MTSDRQTSEMILSARDICLSRDGNRLLDSVSLDIRRGRITFLLGYNGAGKTLLLSCLHGLLELESGSVDAPPRDRQKMVFQKPIIMRRTAAGHLRFVCPGVAETELADWMKRAGIQDRTSAPARALSGGEQQKLALIGALATSMGELAFAMALGIVLLLVALLVNIASQILRNSLRNFGHDV